MKHTLILLMFLMISSCARKVEVRAPAPEIIRGDRYLYTKGDNGRVYIVTSNTKDFDEAMKAIHPGPSSVEKLDLWVVTPATARKEVH